jgi:Helix-turn-helix domain
VSRDPTRRPNPQGGRNARGAWVPPDAFGDPALVESDLRVLGILCSFANRRRQAYPSHATLADETGLGERTVRRALVRLRDRGARSYVTWAPHWKSQGGKPGRIRGTNLYTVHFLDDLPAEEPRSQSEYFANRWRDEQ